MGCGFDGLHDSVHQIIWNNNFQFGLTCIFDKVFDDFVFSVPGSILSKSLNFRDSDARKPFPSNATHP